MNADRQDERSYSAARLKRRVELHDRGKGGDILSIMTIRIHPRATSKPSGVDFAFSSGIVVAG
jgi:hypothetical protein